MRESRGVDLQCVCRMSAELPQGQYGPGIGYREYSLLDNPRFHAAHVQPGGNPKLAPPRLAPAIVQVCEVRSTGAKAVLCMVLLGLYSLRLALGAACLNCTQESAIGWECLQPGKGRSCRQPGKLVLPGEVSVSIDAGLKEEELLEALQPLEDERLLMFTDMRQAFGGFSSPKDAERCALHMMPLHRVSFRTVQCRQPADMCWCLGCSGAYRLCRLRKEKLQCMLGRGSSGKAGYAHTGLRSD